jgi:uncharacterized protein
MQANVNPLRANAIAHPTTSPYNRNMDRRPPLSLPELKVALAPFCKKHRIQRLDIFGSAARGDANKSSDVDLLVDFADAANVSTTDLLEMAGEAEELVGAPVDFVVRSSLKSSANNFAKEAILDSSICLYTAAA